jgi:hypothetical protein
MCKVFQRKDLRPDFPVCRSGLNAKARLGGRAFSRFFTTISFVFLYFYFNELKETKMPSLADLFLACKRSRLFGFPVLIFESGRFQGLTCDFWAENAKARAIHLLLRPSGFAPAFGRAVSRFATG